MLFHVIVWLSLGATVVTQSSTPTAYPIDWNNETYGPDGPWYALNARLGLGPLNGHLVGSFQVPMYMTPGQYSFLVAPSFCTDSLPAPPFCQQDAQYTPDPSYGDNVTADNEPLLRQRDASWLYPLPGRGNSSYYAGRMALSSPLATTAVDNGPDPGLVPQIDWPYGFEINKTIGTTIDYPGLSIHPYVGAYSLGYLQLDTPVFGPHGPNEHIVRLTSGVNAWFNNSYIRSPSFGFHIGSAAYKMAPSLVFGGLEQSRLLGTAATQQMQKVGDNTLWRTTLDNVTFETATGAQVFAQPGQNLLSGLLQVSIQPEIPYMVLPRAACDAMAAQLPVKYDARTSLYLWDTTAPHYEAMVRSPGYLNFAFATGGLSIKVPLGLLNLTLEPPLAPGRTSIPYFPCFAQTTTSQPQYALGRAFLQAAFVGGNWRSNDTLPSVFFMGQAPGPGGIEQGGRVEIADTQTQITGASTDWAQSWQGSWTPLSQALSSAGAGEAAPSGGSAGGSGRLSGGAIAGIVVGVVAALALVVAAMVIYYRRRIAATKAPAGPDTTPIDEKRSSQYMSPPPYQAKDGTRTDGGNQERPLELAAEPGVAELGSARQAAQVHEMPSPPTTHELPSPNDHRNRVSELM